jgi:putative pyruvate formate lyase activating enzyme
MRYIAEEISSDTYLNVMGQYRPVYGASEFAEINRQITIHEYREAVEIALQVGLRRLAD